MYKTRQRNADTMSEWHQFNHKHHIIAKSILRSDFLIQIRRSYIKHLYPNNVSPDAFNLRFHYNYNRFSP